MLYRLPQKTTQIRIAIFIMIPLLGILLGMLLATQHAALKMNYSPALGKPVLGRVYNPLNIIHWQKRFGQYERYQNVFRKSFGLLAVSLFISIGVVSVFNYFLRSNYESTDVHGSAHWASYHEIRSTGLLGNTSGLYIGAYENISRKRIEYLRYGGEGHVICFAPTRSGKGVGLVVPNLLTWRYSVIVLDIRQENWNLTAGWRKEHFQNTVIKFDPTSSDGTGAAFNPLYEVRLGAHEVRDVQNIAEMIVDYDGKGKYDHWRLSAYNFLTGVIMHVLYAEKNKTLAGVTSILSDPETSIEKTLERMLDTPHDHDGTRGWISPSTGSPVKIHPVVSNIAREMLNKAPEERSGIISTTLSFLALYRDPVVAANTARSDFRISDLVDSARPLSLYLVIPPSDIARTRPLIRLMLHLMMHRLVEQVKFKKGTNSIPKPECQLLLMLDEFSSLGKLEFIQEAIAYMAAYGLKAFIILQDLTQLYAAYGKEESITGNCHVRIAYAPNKLETAKDLSQMAGTTTVTKVSRNLAGKRTQIVMPHISEGIQETQRPLLMIDEAMRLPADDSLIFVSNMPPIYGKKIKYYRDRELNARAQIHPPLKSDRFAIDPKDFGFPEYIERTPKSEEAVETKDQEIKPQKESMGELFELIEEPLINEKSSDDEYFVESDQQNSPDEDKDLIL